MYAAKKVRPAFICRNTAKNASFYYTDSVTPLAYKSRKNYSQWLLIVSLTL